MIRKLTEKDQVKVLKYLYQEPSLNIFIIGDIELFGFNVDFQDIFAEFDELGQYLSVVLRYKENILYYSHELYFNEDWVELINRYKYEFVSGRKSLIDIIKPYFPKFKSKEMYFSEVNVFDNSLSIDNELVEDMKNEEDAELIFDLLKRIDEFDGMKNQEKDDFIKTKMLSIDHSKTYLIKENGICASTATTVADTKKSAMIVAVATHFDYRKKGYASKIMIKLIHEYLVNQKKSLCLFYDNPSAGKIYHRLGFVDKDMWVMLVEKK